MGMGLTKPIPYVWLDFFTIQTHSSKELGLPKIWESHFYPLHRFEKTIPLGIICAILLLQHRQKQRTCCCATRKGKQRMNFSNLTFCHSESSQIPHHHHTVLHHYHFGSSQGSSDSTTTFSPLDCHNSPQTTPPLAIFESVPVTTIDPINTAKLNYKCSICDIAFFSYQSLYMTDPWHETF